MNWMNTLGEKYWPILGAAYCVVAVKRVQGMRMISPAWKRNPKLAATPVAVAPRSANSSAQSSRKMED
jgi:hypothetical protein